MDSTFDRSDVSLCELFGIVDRPQKQVVAFVRELEDARFVVNHWCSIGAVRLFLVLHGDGKEGIIRGTHCDVFPSAFPHLRRILAEKKTR